MAKIVRYENVPLDDLVIGKGQVRTQDISAGIDELAESIEAQGLLQPIVVCKTEQLGKWEILSGQRRFLAHKKLQVLQKLKVDTIAVAIIDERVDEDEAKAISITENLMRRKLSGKDLKDGILFLYNKYGNVREVAKMTGIPSRIVRDNVKYPRLIPELKEKVDDQTIDINAAIRAQDAATATDSDVPDPELAVKYAEELQPMSNIQRDNVTKKHKENPDMPMQEVIERAKTGEKVMQISATISQDTHTAIKKVAVDEKKNQDETVTMLIEEALSERGVLGGD